MGNRKSMRIILIAAAVVLLLSIIVAGRLAWAYFQVNEAEASRESTIGNEIGSAGSVSILPLYENWASSNELQSGHGVSYLIRTDGQTILMDLGNNEQNLERAPLEHNMEQLGIKADEIDRLVISHNHPDHVGGLAEWTRGTIAAGTQREFLTGKKAYLPVELICPGLEGEVSTEPKVIAPGVATLGRQPFVQPFPLYLWDPLGWEQSLVINVEGKGLVIVTGCGHPSIERIIERAEAIFPQPVIGVVGGLHYGKAEEETLAPHIDFLSLRKPELVALSPHDSSGGVLQRFEAAFPKAYRYITIGTVIEYPKDISQ